MAIYGYARVSTKDQDLTIQLEALKIAGCEIIRAEKRSGTSLKNRSELDILLEFMRQGDILMVTRVDRLARSIRDLQNIIHELKKRGVAIKATEQAIDTSTAAGKFFLDMLGVFSEFETTIRKERQAEGIAKARARGAYKGAKRVIDGDAVQKLKADGLGATAVARKLNISRASVYRLTKTDRGLNR